MSRGRELALAAAVALAFADSSIVVLALPDLIDRFDTSIESVSWVVTSYNLVVAVVAVGLALAGLPFDLRRVVQVGLALFLAASLACALSTGLWELVTFRCVQGIGAALLLSASLPLLGSAGARRWAYAGAIGTAIGPAAGGLLTQLFDWRAIFVAQAPFAALALVSVPAAGAIEAARPNGAARLRGLGANAALALVSGALVGALFLAVVLLIDGWRLSPIEAAAVVSALPLASFAARPLTRAAGTAAIAGTGALVLAAGLAGLALLPADEVAWVAASLAFCGIGLGLAVPTLTTAGLTSSRQPRVAGAWSTGLRHLGLVLALVLLTPLLARDLEAGATRAKLVGTGLVLDAPLSAGTKVPLAIDLARALDRAPRGKVPDFTPQFARYQGVGSLRRSLTETLQAIVTRSFRGAFAVSAALALLALAPLLLLRRRPAA
jgi:predicted MFS family arabinose efflux permease